MPAAAPPSRSTSPSSAAAWSGRVLPRRCAARACACCWSRRVPFDAGAQPSFDARTTALGNASRRIFEALGRLGAAAPQAAADPLHPRLGGRALRLRAPEAARAGRRGLRLRRRQPRAGGRAVGAAAGRARNSRCACRRGVDGRRHRRGRGAPAARAMRRARAEAVRARLVVAADGAHSQVRSAAGIDAQRRGLRAGGASSPTSLPISRTRARAYERFTAAGPLAVLPLHDGSLAVIWALRAGSAQRAAGSSTTRPTSRSCRAPSAGAPAASCAPGGAAPIRCSSRAPQPRWPRAPC